tara:strand:- start:24400 stop:25173 length:774 start_codon:yes stop_codon:yes gene_type:complete
MSDLAGINNPDKCKNVETIRLLKDDAAAQKELKEVYEGKYKDYKGKVNRLNKKVRKLNERLAAAKKADVASCKADCACKEKDATIKALQDRVAELESAPSPFKLFCELKIAIQNKDFATAFTTAQLLAKEIDPNLAAELGVASLITKLFERARGAGIPIPVGVGALIGQLIAPSTDGTDTTTTVPTNPATGEPTTGTNPPVVKPDPTLEEQIGGAVDNLATDLTGNETVGDVLGALAGLGLGALGNFLENQGDSSTA